MVVAIDGPAGAGKSTAAKLLARELGFSFLDSGALYRAVALSLTRQPGSAAERARDVRIELGDRVLLDGEDVSAAIRTPQVSEAASRIASDPGVRAALVKKQRDMLQQGDWVGEGRDIGTVVAPHAELKIFLTASPEARARRRAMDLGQADWRVVMKDQALRDQQDSEREHSPLRAAPDSIELDSTDRPVEDVVRQIAGLVREAKSRRGEGEAGGAAGARSGGQAGGGAGARSGRGREAGGEGAGARGGGAPPGGAPFESPDA